MRRYEKVLGLKTVESLCRLSGLFVKRPLFWDFVIEALACKFALLFSLIKLLISSHMCLNRTRYMFERWFT